MTQPLLFTPLPIRGRTLKNRVVVAPMHQYSAIKGFATDWHIMNAGRYAAGGAGLVIVESTKIERRGCGTVGDLGLWDDAFVPQLARIVDLLHQFLSPLANQRSDEYGGSQTNRMRFACEVVKCVRANWPEEKPLFLRLSAEDDAGWGPAQSVELAKLVKPLGVDVIDCSSGGILDRPPAGAAKPAYGYQVPYADQIRRQAGTMTMAVGLIVHAEQAERILQQGQADLVALAREMLYNPNWAMDAAQKLGLDPGFALLPPPYQYWLARRAATVPEVLPSTFATRPATHN
mgnify:FL=1